MALSDPMLDEISSFVGLEGTGKNFSTPVIYRFLEKYVPSLLRSITNVHISGIDKVPMNGAAIFCGNHLGNLDPFLKILVAQRPIHFMAKEGHFEKQPNRFVMISTGQIQTFRERGGLDALARAVDVIESGHCLGIFPEGTRSRREERPFLQPGKTGFARLSARFPNVPIVPIAISSGAREFMKPGSKLPKPWKKIEITVGEPITFAEWISDKDGGNKNEEWVREMSNFDEERKKENMKELYRRFTDQMMETLKFMGAP
ncbi:MAG: hypothetical protein CMB02_00890 [Euryarchaeota archaeon]|nr:hypothetical protein [Euryarchaeota archaeon]